jgi:hypothetical protein
MTKLSAWDIKVGGLLCILLGSGVLACNDATFSGRKSKVEVNREDSRVAESGNATNGVSEGENSADAGVKNDSLVADESNPSDQDAASAKTSNCGTEPFDLLSVEADPQASNSGISGSVDLSGSGIKRGIAINGSKYPNLESVCLNFSGSGHQIAVKTSKALKSVKMFFSGSHHLISIEVEKDAALDSTELSLSGAYNKVYLYGAGQLNCEKVAKQVNGTENTFSCGTAP